MTGDWAHLSCRQTVRVGSTPSPASVEAVPRRQLGVGVRVDGVQRDLYTTVL
jgi:hypothetical protein